MRLKTAASALALSLIAAPALAAPAYTLAKTVPLGAPDRWDYVVFDQGTNRVYLAHGDRVTVVDPVTGAIAGTVEGIPGGTHGTAISIATGQGFTDDGEAGTAVAYDLKTLKIRASIPAAEDADGMSIEKSTGHVFVVNGDSGSVTAIDPVTNKPVATIKIGEKLEYPVGNDAGTLFVAGAEKGDVVRIDARTNTVTAQWTVPGCIKPHGLALDKAAQRLFLGCANAVMPVVDAETGKVVTTLPIGRGNDAVAFDSVRKRVFSSNGLDGTISVYQQTSADHYTPLETIRTQVSGRTMSLDPATGRLFVAAADADPDPAPGGKPKPRPGTLKLLMFDPD